MIYVELGSGQKKMKKENLSADQAFKKLLGTTLYKHLVDAETGLLYEPEGYLEEALNIELEYGIEQHYDFIKV